jgi:hypothetical protein
VAQFPPVPAAGAADANGDLTLTFRGRSNDVVRVTQVTAEMPTGAAAQCSCRRNGFLVSPMVPTGDAASGDPPIWLGPGDELTVVWSGAPAGAVGKMLVIFDLGT